MKWLLAILPTAAIGFACFTIADFGLAKLEQKTLDAIKVRDELADSILSLQQRKLNLEEAEASVVIPKGATLETVSDSEGELALQNIVLDIGESIGIVPLSFGRTAAPSELGDAAVGFRVELETSNESAVEFLAKLEASSPTLGFKTVWLRSLPPSSLPDLPAPVYARIETWALLKPAADPDQ